MRADAGSASAEGSGQTGGSVICWVPEPIAAPYGRKTVTVSAKTSPRFQRRAVRQSWKVPKAPRSRADVVARTDDGHRAVGQRGTADALVRRRAGRQAEVARLVVGEDVAVVRGLAVRVVAQLVGRGPQRRVVTADRDLALDAGGVDPREHAGRDPALAAAVARAVRAAPVGREPDRARELVGRSVDLDGHAGAVGQRARHDVLQAARAPAGRAARWR